MATWHKAKQRWISTYKTKSGKRLFFTERTAEAADQRAEAARLLDQNTAPILSTNDTIHDLARILWWPRVEGLRPNSIRRYQDAYKRHVRPIFGPLSPSDIRPFHVQKWISDQQAQGLSASSIILNKSILATILKLCVAEGLISSNPASTAKMPQRATRVRTKKPDEIRELLMAVQGTELSAPVFLAAVLGMSRGEICGLKWANCVDGRISIDSQRLIERGAGKGKSLKDGAPTKRPSRVRSFLLPRALWDVLVKSSDLTSPYVCSRRGQPWNPEHLTAEWAKVRDRLGFADWHLHDLRHAAAGTLAYLGVDLLTIAAILGHKSIDTTQLYAASQESTATRGFEAVAKEMFGAIGSEEGLS